jgi:hypothetical protein
MLTGGIAAVTSRDVIVEFKYLQRSGGIQATKKFSASD